MLPVDEFTQCDASWSKPPLHPSPWRQPPDAETASNGRLCARRGAAQPPHAVLRPTHCGPHFNPPPPPIFKEIERRLFLRCQGGASTCNCRSRKVGRQWESIPVRTGEGSQSRLVVWAGFVLAVFFIVNHEHPLLPALKDAQSGQAQESVTHPPGSRPVRPSTTIPPTRALISSNLACPFSEWQDFQETRVTPAPGWS
jgi:hypothetical protein